MFASDYRKLARKSLNERWGISILICVIGMILGGIFMENLFEITFNNHGNIMGEYGLQVRMFGFSWNYTSISDGLIHFLTLGAIIFSIIGIIRFVIGGAVKLGVCSYFSKSALGLKAGVEDEFHYFNIFGKAFVLRFMMTLFTVLWTFLFIIPGIIAAYKYCMAPYILAEHPDMDVFEAINQSKAMMDGMKFRKFCLDFSFIGWAFLSSLTLGIGYLFLNPYVNMAEAHFYFSITRPQNYPEYNIH